MRLTDKQMDRFWSKVKIREMSGCWEWSGYKNKQGYGQIKLNGKSVWAHRAAYEIGHGNDPSGLVVRHKCDNPSCCNPSHLILGTLADNAADRVERMRSAFGTKNCNAKLTEKDIPRIRRDRRPLKDIAKEYGLHASNIERVKKRQSWRHVE